MTGSFWGAIIDPLCDVGTCDDIGDDIGPFFAILAELDSVSFSYHGDEFEKFVLIG